MIVDALTALITAVGAAWLAAVGLSFIASTAEASNPAPKGEVKLGPLGTVGGFVSLLTPFLVLIHGYWSVTLKRHPMTADTDIMTLAIMTFDNLVLTAILIVFAMLTVLPMLPGLIIRKAVPGLGLALYKASPILHIVAFAVAAFATYESVYTVLMAFISGAPPAVAYP